LNNELAQLKAQNKKLLELVASKTATNEERGEEAKMGQSSSNDHGNEEEPRKRTKEMNKIGIGTRKL
jgi:hypothetical protein